MFDRFHSKETVRSSEGNADAINHAVWQERKDESARESTAQRLAKELQPSGKPVSAPVELPDHTKFAEYDQGNGKSVQVYSKGAETIQYSWDKAGQMEQQLSRDADGRIVNLGFNKNILTEIGITNKDGTSTALKRTQNPNGARIWNGAENDEAGKEIAHQFWRLYYLASIDMKSKDLTVTKVDFKFNEPEQKEHMPALPQFTPGKYDGNLGKFIYKDDKGVVQIESIGQGRVDKVLADGSKEWHSKYNEISMHMDKNGQAQIKNWDGSEVTLDAQNTIKVWKTMSDGEKKLALDEPLSSAEGAFLAKHKANPMFDTRDLAEIHKLFADTPKRLDDFYGQLAKFDNIGFLTQEEREALQIDIMHNVACPGEIYQGTAGSCNVTQVQRILATTEPETLASFIYDALGQGAFTDVDGKSYSFTNGNLMLLDLSGRDLASRVFQNAAIEIAATRKGEKFHNTPDAEGMIKNLKTKKQEAFPGLNIYEVADLAHLITGKNFAAGIVQGEETLKSAFEINGQHPMVLVVDADKRPFAKKDAPEYGGHVVTLTGIIPGAESALTKSKTAGAAGARLLLQNQYGFADDHSTPKTSVDPKVFMHSFLSGPDKSGNSIAKKYGYVLISNPELEQGKTYQINKNGTGSEVRLT